MDLFRLDSLRWTQWIQQSIGLHNKYTEIGRSFSSMFETYYFYVWIYPICHLIHPILGHKMLFSFILSELICIILKCIFHDDRPSWWFQGLDYSPNGAPENTLYELPETCENTSGFPSIHTALLAAFSVVLFLFYTDHMRGHVFTPKVHQRIQIVLFVILSILNEMAFLGRLFVATNFHYQLVAGTMIGLFAGNYASIHTSRLFAFNASRAWKFLGSAISVLLVLVIACFIADWDPFWSVPRILNSCWTTAHAYAHLKYNFGYYVLRMTGNIFGMVLSNNYGGIWDSIYSCSTSEKRIIYSLYVLEIFLMNWAQSIELFHMIVLQLLLQSIFFGTHVILISSIIPKSGMWIMAFADSQTKLIKAKYKEFGLVSRLKNMKIFNRKMPTSTTTSTS